MDGATMGTIRLGSLELSYRRAGRGTPVLLLLSGGDELETGEEFFRRLAEQARVVALCHDPGHGSESDQDGSALLRDLREGLGLEDPLVVADEAWAARLNRRQGVRPEQSTLVWRTEDGASTILAHLNAIGGSGSPVTETEPPHPLQGDSRSRS